MEISSSWGQIGLVVLSSLAILIAVVAFVRIIGLRSFSKMSSFDFAVTVAMGSLLASVAALLRRLTPLAAGPDLLGPRSPVKAVPASR